MERQELQMELFRCLRGRDISDHVAQEDAILWWYMCQYGKEEIYGSFSDMSHKEVCRLLIEGMNPFTFDDMMDAMLGNINDDYPASLHEFLISLCNFYKEI